jgi:hypothetical protein
MLTHSHSVIHPWVCVKADDKKSARLAIIQHILSLIAPAKLRKGVDRPDPAVLFQFEPEALGDGRLAR